MTAGRPLIRDTQTMMEGPLPVLPKGPIKLTPSLETILEVSSQKENARTESRGVTERTTYVSRETVPLEEIPEADENLASSLWREVRKQVEEERSGRASPPFPFMEENHPLEDKWAADSLNRHTATRSLYGEHNEEQGENQRRNQETKEDLKGVIANQAYLR